MLWCCTVPSLRNQARIPTSLCLEEQGRACVRELRNDQKAQQTSLPFFVLLAIPRFVLRRTCTPITPRGCAPIFPSFRANCFSSTNAGGTLLSLICSGPTSSA